MGTGSENRVFKWLPWVVSIITTVLLIFTQINSCVITPNLAQVYQTKAHAKELDTAAKTDISKNSARIEDHEKRLTRSEALMDRIEKTLDRIEPLLYRRGRK